MTRLRGLAASWDAEQLGGPGAAAESGVGGSGGSLHTPRLTHPLKVHSARPLLLLSGKAGQPGLDPGMDKRMHNGWSALLGFQAPSERGVDGLGSVNLRRDASASLLTNPEMGRGAADQSLSRVRAPTSHSRPACSPESLSLSLRAISRPCQAFQQQSHV